MNARESLGSRLCGMGISRTEAICGMLDAPFLLAQTSYDTYALHVCNHLAEMADDQQKHAARSLKIALGGRPNDTMDVPVTCDCTWSKRGFTAPYGVAVVISWKTGEMLDCEVFNKCCSTCSCRESRNRDSEGIRTTICGPSLAPSLAPL